jgi:hypothetical protein
MTKLEQQTMGLWTAGWLFQAIFHALDPEERERYLIEVGPDWTEGEGLWPEGVKIADLTIEPHARDDLDDLGPMAQSRARGQAQLNAAKILASLNADRLKACGTELFNDAL